MLYLFIFLWVFQVPFSLFQKMKIDKRNTAQTFSKRKENWPNYWLLLFQAYIRAFPQSSRFSYAHLIFAKKALGRITRNNDIFCLIFYPQWLRKARTSKPKSVNLAVIFYHLFWEKKRSLDLPPFHWHWGVLFNAKQSKERRKKEVKNHCIQFFFPFLTCRCPYLHRTAGDTERRYHLKYYKTGMCVHDTDNRGFCVKNGPHCAFAHGTNDLRPAVYDIR